ncbi:MAG: lysophospholipid acyltransferase family protein [Gammaproteobacteria bacterium]|nr:lysophospholipid acyltransferase family protein [Gammaproteobacteria bacterium]
MPDSRTDRTTFSVGPYLPRWPARLRRMITRLADSALGFSSLTRRYHRIPAAETPAQFAGLALEELGVTPLFEADELDLIPAEGGCLLIANHPHGGLDGLILMEVLLQRRPDVRFLANHFLASFQELGPLFLKVNPFGGNEARRFNSSAAREALAWLKQGGLLVMFPGGEVSSVDWRTRRVIDPEWDRGIARLAAQTGVPVVPCHIGGRNSLWFQLAGLIHPRLRTALLAREMLNARDRQIDLRFGTPIEPEVLAGLPDRTQVTRYLRTKTYLLAERPTARLVLGRAGSPRRPEESLSDAVDSEVIEDEIRSLPPGQCIMTSGQFQVWHAASGQIPWLLQEIGRLREVSFREVGEGTGKRSDLDLFDTYYTHLFVWDSRKRLVVGGYRLGHADEILRQYGPKGLYVHSLFKLDPALGTDLSRAIEVGRSFVSPAYQRSYSALLLLWKGVATYMALRPQYQILFGPVSISNDYHPISKQILVRFLRHHKFELRRASLVKPRRPFREREHAAASVVDLDDGDLRLVADLLGTVEPDERGVPVLLRQYLKLGGRILGFNIDNQFGNSIDCLLWVDMRRTELPLLRKYMGTELAGRFHALHVAGMEDPVPQPRQG